MGGGHSYVSVVVFTEEEIMENLEMKYILPYEEQK